jgi:hypothetical protein
MQKINGGLRGKLKKNGPELKKNGDGKRRRGS